MKTLLRWLPLWAMMAGLPPALHGGDPPPPAPRDAGEEAEVHHDTPPPASRPAADYGYRVAWTPLQIGVVGRYQLFHRDTRVEGLALGLAGVHSGRTNGLALAPVYTETAGTTVGRLQAAGVINLAEGYQRGIQLAGLGNNAAEGVCGLQAAGLGNHTHGGIDGLQAGLIVNIAENSSRGMQVGAFNSLRGESIAFQAGVVGNHLGHSESRRGGDPEASCIAQTSLVYNYSAPGARGTGAMLTGICNWAVEGFSGVQVGLVNLTGEMCGVQIGLLNDSEDLRGVQVGLFNFQEGRMRLPLLNIGWGRGED